MRCEVHHVQISVTDGLISAFTAVGSFDGATLEPSTRVTTPKARSMLGYGCTTQLPDLWCTLGACDSVTYVPTFADMCTAAPTATRTVWPAPANSRLNHSRRTRLDGRSSLSIQARRCGTNGPAGL